jgi:hypothetical protein
MFAFNMDAWQKRGVCDIYEVLCPQRIQCRQTALYFENRQTVMRN